MKSLLCKHEWHRVGQLEHLKYNTQGAEIQLAMCRCAKCGTFKTKKFEGRIIGYSAK